MSKSIFLFLFTALLCCSIYSQDRTVDSLKQELTKNLPDSARTSLIIETADELLHILKLSEALSYAKEAESISLKLKNTNLLIKTYSRMGAIYFRMNQLENAYLYENKAYDLALKTNNLKIQAEYYATMANIYDGQGDHSKVIESLLEELKIDERINDPNRMLGIYSRLATVYFDNGDFDKALECEFKVLDVSRKMKNDIFICVALDKIGSYYSEKGEFDKAEENFLNAMNLAKKIKRENILGYSQIHYGDFCFKQKKYKDAINYYRSGMKLAYAPKSKSPQVTINIKIVKALFELKKYSEAEKPLATVIKLASELKMNAILLVGYEYMAKIDSMKGNFKAAFGWKNNILNIKEELSKESNARAIGRIETKFELRKEEERRKAEEEVKDLESRSAISKQKQIIYTAVIIIPLLILTIYLLYRSRKQEKINNETLQQKVEERTREFLIAKEKAESSEQLKSIFLSQMSHEIRTPLNAMMNLSSILNEEFKNLSDEDIKDLIWGIDRSGNRIIRTIEMILNYSEIVSDSYHPLFKEVSIDSICRDVINETKYLGKHDTLSITYFSNSDLAVINGDEYSIHNVIKNIVENAIIYTERGSVEIKLTDEGERLVFTCRDTGIGLSDEYKEKLFQPFTQEQLGYTRKYEGLGLGLALSHFYCDLNNAEISCESRKGEGSIFKVVFKK